MTKARTGAQFYPKNRAKAGTYLDRAAYEKARGQRRRVAKLERLAGRPRAENCEVCGDGGPICWDHNHTTGKFRGWLCRSCNAALGMVRDNPEVLRALANYLEVN